MRIFLLLLAIIAINIYAQDATEYPYYYKTQITSAPVAEQLYENIMIFDYSPPDELTLNAALGITVKNYSLIGNEVHFFYGEYEVPEDAFALDDRLLSINLSATNIEHAGFFICYNLASATLNRLRSLNGDHSMNNTALTSINWPECTRIGYESLGSNNMLQEIILPKLISIYPYALSGSCYSTDNLIFYFPKCEGLGYSTGDDNIFSDITGKDITLTIPAALMTCNGGNPDGDIQYLQANNTVTIIQVP